VHIAIIDYQAGNQTSVQRAFAHLGQTAVITPDPEVIAKADKVIFPGVGAAGSCMANLTRGGMDQALREVIASGRPVLCVCVGMQLLFERSEEDGGTPCLGVLPGVVQRFRPTDPTVKVPHMGWNPVRHGGRDPLFAGIPDEAEFYFVHSYHCVPGDGVQVIAGSHHGAPFCAAVRRGNVAAMQFHPEKSGPYGLRLLRNFLAD
jgi:glutamine amidotransferase